MSTAYVYKCRLARCSFWMQKQSLWPSRCPAPAWKRLCVSRSDCTCAIVLVMAAWPLMIHRIASSRLTYKKISSFFMAHQRTSHKELNLPPRQTCTHALTHARSSTWMPVLLSTASQLPQTLHSSMSLLIMAYISLSMWPQDWVSK